MEFVKPLKLPYYKNTKEEQNISSFVGLLWKPDGLYKTLN